jgi:hypothetical protein
MNAAFMSQRTKRAVLSSLLATLLSVSAQAGFYPFSPPGSGTIPQDGTVFSTEYAIPYTIEHVITSVELILKFSDSASLTGNPLSGIQGLLNLGITAGSPFVSFSPTVTSTSGSYSIYDVTFTGASGTPGTGFNGLDPNSTWGLVLWDNSGSGIENSLVSWTLDITAVPEPENVALGCFAGVFLVVSLVRSQRVRKRVQRCWAGINEWLDAV